MNRRTFSPARRLRRPQDFERVYAQNQRAGDACLLLLAAANSTGRTRLGLSVSRKHGNSVARHRLKRLLREAYRLEQDHVPEGLDLVLVPKQNAQAGLEQYRAAIVRLSRKLARRLLPGESRPTSPPAPSTEPPP